MTVAGKENKIVAIWSPLLSGEALERKYFVAVDKWLIGGFISMETFTSVESGTTTTRMQANSRNNKQPKKQLRGRNFLIMFHVMKYRAVCG